MQLMFDENSTRKNIMIALKKSGGMSIDELSKVIDITPMGIRQHLLALEKKGMVTYVSRKRGIGRPGFIYMLTEIADEMFPKSYDKLILGMLRDIRKYDGEEKIDKIFSWRRDRLYRIQKEASAGKSSIDESLDSLKTILEADGYFVEIDRVNGHYLMKNYNCPINRVAAEFRDACHHELQMYRDLFGKNVSREKTLANGDPACIYKIPAS